MPENAELYQEGFSDRPALEQLVRALQLLKFSSPKWTYSFDVPLGELVPCYKPRRKGFPLMCDVVAYREGVPVATFEMDGGHHATKEQQERDARKERHLAGHAIRLWRMWNPELAKIWGCTFDDLLVGEPESMEPEYARIFRRDVKASLYAPHGSLASDWKRLCPKCYGED